MHTVVETRTFTASAKAERLTGEEVSVITDIVAADPLAGDLIIGSGGCRKVRIAGRGRGKSGGYRVVTGFGRGPFVFLVAVLSKGTRGAFSAAEVNAMSKSVVGFKQYGQG